MKTLQRYAILCLAAVAALLCTGCDNALDMPDGRWVLTEYTGTNGNVMTIDFDNYHKAMYVENATDEMPPFHYASEWEYRLDRDSVLHIYYKAVTGTDAEGDVIVTTYSYKLPLSFSDSGRTLTLRYEEPRLFKPDVPHTYTFIRR